MPEIQGVNHIALTVTSVDESFAWYEKVLGVQKIMDDKGDGYERAVTITGPLIIGFTKHEKTDPSDRFSEFRVGMDHVGFACADKAAVEEWAAHLDSLGIAHSGVIDSGYGFHVNLRDPDNNALEFFAMPS
jgi:catechol 2,3-dioxygenase-like lactoylglutathione lyase family enzyme